jgi:hypothetical protein
MPVGVGLRMRPPEEREGHHRKVQGWRKGVPQKPGVHYANIWAPVSPYKTLCILLALVTTGHQHLQQPDIKSAFLKGNINEDIYIVQPP